MAVSTRDDNQKVVDMSVSTPNGISNRIQIPIRPAVPIATVPGTGAGGSPSAAAPSFTIIDSSLTIGLNSHIDPTSGKPVNDGPKPVSPGVVRIQPFNVAPPLPPAILLQMVFSTGTVSLGVTQDNVPLVNGNYVLASTMLDGIAQTLVALLNKNKLNTGTLTLTSQSITIAPAGSPLPLGAPGSTTPTFTTNNKLTITLDPGLTPLSSKSRGRAPADQGVASRDRDGSVDPMTRRTSADALPPLPEEMQVPGDSLPIPIPVPTVPAVPAPPTLPAVPNVLMVPAPSTSTNTILMLPQIGQARPGSQTINIVVPTAPGRSTASSAGTRTRRRRRPTPRGRSWNGSSGALEDQVFGGKGGGV